MLTLMQLPDLAVSRKTTFPSRCRLIVASGDVTTGPSGPGGGERGGLRTAVRVRRGRVLGVVRGGRDGRARAVGSVPCPRRRHGVLVGHPSSVAMIFFRFLERLERGPGREKRTW